MSKSQDQTIILPPLTQERLKELLVYDEVTGHFTWRVNRNTRTKAGDKAGSTDKHGYIIIGVDHKYYKAHRLAWLYVHGEWPNGAIDHKFHAVADNRISELRDGTMAQNKGNLIKARSDNKTSGLLGVSWHKRAKKWTSYITRNGVSHFVGYFDDPQEAHQAYLSAKRKLHDFNVL